MPKHLREAKRTWEGYRDPLVGRSLSGAELRVIPDALRSSRTYSGLQPALLRGPPGGGAVKAALQPQDLVRNIVLADYRPVDDLIQIVREKHAGKDAAFAVAFEDRDGWQGRGLIGLCRHSSKTWDRCGGFMGTTPVIGQRDVWMTWGGWGPGDDSRERAVAGGWVADLTAASARLIDGAGRVLDDQVENGVFLFMWKGDLNLRTARLDLLDASGQVVRSGPMRRQR